MADTIFTNDTLASRVTNQLRDDIISKKIEMGSRITIKEISEQYHVSPMPVREAFRTLEGEMLLKINAYKGATVLPIDKTFVSDIYGILRALEALVYESAMDSLGEEGLAELRSINQKIYDLGTQDSNVARYIELNKAFHDVLIERHTNRKAVELYGYYKMLIYSIRKQYGPKGERIVIAAQEHDAIIEGLANHDIGAIRHATDIHINSAMNSFIEDYELE